MTCPLPLTKSLNFRKNLRLCQRQRCQRSPERPTLIPTSQVQWICWARHNGRSIWRHTILSLPTCRQTGSTLPPGRWHWARARAMDKGTSMNSDALPSSQMAQPSCTDGLETNAPSGGNTPFSSHSDTTGARILPGSSSNFPWLARPSWPDGAGRAEPEHAIGDAPGPDAELSLPVRNELAARRWLVQQIARRTVEILAEGNDEEQKGHIR